MEITCSYIFVYGTLLMSGNKYAAYLQKHCKLIGKGKINGRLYDVGEYPGAVIDNNNHCYIYGNIYSMDNPQDVLKIIDEYEGLGPAESQPYEYIRSIVDVETGGELVACWMYLYNWSFSGLAEVPGGRYPDYLNLKI